MNEKRLNQQLRTFERILTAYTFEEPLARFLTNYYKQHRQMGSNDRRTASRLVYNYFRLGNGFSDLRVVDRLAIAEFLCTSSSDFVALLAPDFLPYMEVNLAKKVSVLKEKYHFSDASIFPLFEQVSEAITKEKFVHSHFKQPRLFIRIHRGKEGFVRKILKQQQIDYNEIAPNTLSFANGTQLDRIPAIQGKYEVQDLNSQRTAEFFQPKANENWWDTCAASGGKSILLKEIEPTVNLLVSDVRNSILKNLDSRFESYGIDNYRQKIIDLTKSASDVLGNEAFDGILVDAPCSGSGTWSRTPEWMSSFTASKLQHYVDLQRSILANVTAHVKPGKPLIYITCSVYGSENEDQIDFLKSKGFTLEAMQYLEGAEVNADTLFVARLIREL